jgi:ribosomal protein L3 glutamine methyltransferase
MRLMMISHDNLIRQLHTIKDYIRWGVSRFNEAGLTYGHGTDNALDEVIALIYHTLHLPHDLPNELTSCNITEEEKRRVIDIIDRRIVERIPAAYLTHEAWFAGMPFYVDERVLVPRSPIAELIENHFEPWVKDQHSISHILDLCTGSGCIAIATAAAFPEAEVDAVDLSTDALDVCRKNIELHHMTGIVHAIQSDLFEQLEGKCYDLIVSNPPYVDAEDMAQLTDEYKHEPVLGLAAGSDGLDIVARMLQQAPAYLAPDGILFVEVGNSAPALEAKYPDVPFIWINIERGGSGVFMIGRQQLIDNKEVFNI